MSRRKEDDPLVGWIYKQPKDELVELYRKYFKKPEDYKVEELRKRIKTLVRENKELGHQLANDYKLKSKKSKVKTDHTPRTEGETGVANPGGSTTPGDAAAPSTSAQARSQDPKPEEQDDEN